MVSKVYYMVCFNKNKDGKLFNTYFDDKDDFTAFVNAKHYITDLLNLGYEKVIFYKIEESEKGYSMDLLDCHIG